MSKLDWSRGGTSYRGRERDQASPVGFKSGEPDDERFSLFSVECRGCKRKETRRLARGRVMSGQVRCRACGGKVWTTKTAMPSGPFDLEAAIAAFKAKKGENDGSSTR